MEEKILKIVITGGSSGLGLSIIHEFIRLRCCNYIPKFEIYNVDINPSPKMEELSESHPFFPEDIKIIDIYCDLSNTFDTINISSVLPVEIDILINNCGVNYIEWIDTIDMDRYNYIFNVNVHAGVALVKSNLDALRGGTVLNIISNASDMAMTNSLAYNGSKGAQKIMTKQMARELGKTHNITVFGISPNKLNDTGMSRYIDKRVCELRGWTTEEAQKYQVSGLPCGEETDKDVLAEFITFLLSRKERHKYLQGCILPYGGPMGN